MSPKREPPPADHGPGGGTNSTALATGTPQGTTPGGYVWRDSMGETIVIPPEKLASHTLGWWQRNLPDTDPTECEPLWKVALAHELLLEAQRRIIIERLDSVMEFLAVGATPAQAMDRVHKLVLEYYGRPAATMKAAA